MCGDTVRGSLVECKGVSGDVSKGTAVSFIEYPGGGVGDAIVAPLMGGCIASLAGVNV